jgi:hypothetical protein
MSASCRHKSAVKPISTLKAKWSVVMTTNRFTFKTFNFVFLIFILVCILLAIPASSADGALLISFKNPDIKITSPSVNGEAYLDQVKITGTSSLDTVWLCVRGPQNEIAAYPVRVIDNSFEYTMYLRFGPGKYTIWAGDNGKRFDGSIRFEVESITEEDGRFLMPSPYVDSNNPEIIRLAQSLTQPQMADYDKIDAIHHWVATNISYDTVAFKTKDYRLKKASEVLHEKTGTCRDYSFLVAALSRASGLPSRVVYGTAKDSNNALQDHAWVEILVNDRWITVDATWDAGYIQGETFVFAYSDKYFNPDQNLFAMSHTKNSVTLY